MSTLTSRFPSARRIRLSSGAAGDPDDATSIDVARLIEPYLNWELLEVDSSSTDILIGEPESALHTGEPSQLLILGGEEAQMWLRKVRKSAQ